MLYILSSIYADILLYTYWSFSKYGGELLLSGKNNAIWTVVAIAGGSSRDTLTSSAIIVNSTGSPICVKAAISSSGCNRNISPMWHDNKKKNWFCKYYIAKLKVQH